MARINLLPWRDELRKEQQRQFMSMMGGSVAIMLLIIVMAHLRVSMWISTQQDRNNYLSQQITEVENRIKEINEIEKRKQQLVARMKVIERLQRNRPEVVHLFDELVHATPDGLHLTSMKQQDSSLKLEGIAQSNARVSQFMRNLEASPYLESPVLDIIKTSEKAATRKFTLNVTQTLTTADQATQAPKAPQQKR